LKNLFLIQPNRLIRRIYPRALWNLPRNEKAIYLTFDDGPIPGLTEWVLDELKKYDASATFFCVGANIRRYPGLFDRMKREGHLPANHTMHHTRGSRSSLYSYIKEVEECRSLVNNNLFRPPYGQLRRAQYIALLKKGYRIVLWDVISYDYEKITPVNCAKNVINKVRPGSIVLFHDNPKAEANLRHSLPLVLEHFSKQGYSFRNLAA
jgi:peptidoglycan-N-acetylglucosamine deacetylase